MPIDPSEKGDFEFHKNKRSKHESKPICSEEELGDMHLSTENYSVALEYFEKAVQKIHETAPERTDLIRVYRKISDCYRKKGLFREALTFLKSAESICDEDDSFNRSTLAWRRGIILREEGEIEEALREACSAYRVLRLSNDHREVAHNQLLLANCYFRLGRGKEAEQYFLDALSSYRRIDDSVGEAYVLNNLGLFHKNACRWGRALHFFNRSLEICDEIGLTQHRVRVTLNMGIVHLKKHDYPSAEAAFSRARGMARRGGDNLRYVKSTIMLGVVEIHTGNLPLAEKHLLEAQVLAERNNYRREIALADEFLGDLMFERGDMKGAIENYTASLSKARKITPEGDIVAEVLRRMIGVFLVQKKSREVVSTGKKALGIASRCGEIHEVGFIQRTMGLAYAQLKKVEEAQKYINSSVRTFLDVNNPYEANRSAYMLGEYLLKRADKKSLIRARVLVGKTLSFFERNEYYRDMARSHHLLAKIERGLCCRDECLLHIYEAQSLAEDFKDRNLVRCLRRMRKKVEDEVSGKAAIPRVPFQITGKLSKLFSSTPHFRSYLDYILGDLMRRLTAGHGFVALCEGGLRSDKKLILARRGISEDTTRQLTDWFLGREDADMEESLLITDTAHDSRASAIRALLPGKNAPAYFHPLCRDREPFGLLFFQSDGENGNLPRLGPSFEVVSTYAGFIGFLISGIMGDNGHKDGGEVKSTADDFQRIITKNEKMLKVLDLARRVAESNSTVLLMGETGTGKGLIAQAIHRLSHRRDAKFIHVNCAALPENLLESELFGHVKGAFTGAISDKRGLLAEAGGGTIFLDEIGKTSLPLQGKLLQFLDTSKVRPVGGNEMVDVDVRLLFASKVDLLELCGKNKMLEDFYYRINDFPLFIPPLRERTEDIRLLAEHYLRFFSNDMDKNVQGFSGDAISQLLMREWPGNVRELEKVVKRAVILTDDGGIVTRAELSYGQSVSNAETGRCGRSLNDRVKELERRIVSKALLDNSWNRKATASQLGLSYPTLLKKIRDFGLEEGS